MSYAIEAKGPFEPWPKSSYNRNPSLAPGGYSLIAAVIACISVAIGTGTLLER